MPLRFWVAPTATIVGVLDGEAVVRWGTPG